MAEPTDEQLREAEMTVIRWIICAPIVLAMAVGFALFGCRGHEGEG